MEMRGKVILDSMDEAEINGLRYDWEFNRRPESEVPGAVHRGRDFQDHNRDVQKAGRGRLQDFV